MADNPFLQYVGTPQKDEPNPFLQYVGPTATEPQPDLSKASKRLEFERQNLEANLMKLQSIVPANEGHKRRIDKMIDAIKTQLAGKDSYRSRAENFTRGAVAGTLTGFQLPVEIAGNIAAFMGNKDLQNYVEENKNLVKEELDPRNLSGTVGEVAGGILGSTLPGGAAATATGQAFVRAGSRAAIVNGERILVPSTRLAKAIAAGSSAGWKTRAATNVLTGIPLNVVQALGPEIEIPEGASPEEAERIRSLNTANRLKNIAIGIGADALFGALPEARIKERLSGKKAEPVQGPHATVDAETEANLAKVKAQNAVKVAAKLRNRLDKKLAESEWRLLNQNQDFTELSPQAKRKIYDDWNERRRNSNPNTSAGGNPADEQAQLVDLDEKLKLTHERDEARRLAETDDLLNIGNARALNRASPAIDKDPNTVYIFADVNGLKDVNDRAGMGAGNQLLSDARDAAIGALTDHGVPHRIFRFGGDELVLAVPKDKAQTILDALEKNSIKQYGPATGSLSGAIFNKLGDALELEGKNALTSRKIEAKARQGIPGRDAQEQAIIDQVRMRQAQEAAAAAPAPTPVETGPDPFPPEVMEAIRQVEGAGGLRTPEEMESFVQELTNIYDKNPDPDTLGSELQALIDDFTPLELEDIPAGQAAAPEVVAAAGTQGDPLKQPSLVDKLALKQQELDTFAQIDLEHLGDKGYTDFMSRRRGDMTDAEWEKAQMLWKEHDELYQKAKDAGEEVGMDLGFMPTTKFVPDEKWRGDQHIPSGEYVRGKWEEKSPEQKALEDATNFRQPPGEVVSEPAGTRLDTVEHKKPLEELSEKKLDKLSDNLIDAIDNLPKDSPEAALIQRDLDLVHNEIARRNKEAGTAKPIAEARPELPRDPGSGYSSAAPKPTPVAEPAAPKIHPEIERIRRASARKLSNEELDIQIKDLENQQAAEMERQAQTLVSAQNKAAEVRAELEAAKAKGDFDLVGKLEIRARKLEGMALRGEVDDTLIKSVQSKLNKALEERAFRDAANKAVIDGLPKGGVQALAGFGFGFGTSDSEDTPDRVTNGLMWAAVGAGASLAVLRMAAKSKSAHLDMRSPSDVWAGSNVADKKIVHQEDLEPVVKSWRERARDWYTGIVRRSYGIDQAVDVMGGTNLPASRNPAKLAAMFGRWVSMAEGALQDKPVFVDLAGNVVPLPAKAYREIVDMVHGDLRGLGKLMTARASIEGQGLRSVPLDPVTADLIYRSAPKEYHQAADAMRQFDLAMATVLQEAGVIPAGSTDKFALEQFYAGLRKVFDPDAGPSKITRDPKTKKLIFSQNPIKARKSGQTSKVYNPAETSASMVPQIYKSAEMNIIKNRLVDLWEAAGRPDFLLKQVERKRLEISPDQRLRIDALKQEIEGISESTATSIVAAMDPKSLDPRSNMMTVYRDGVLRTYRVDENIASSLASLQPDELEGVWKLLGLPAQMARQGVVLNPYFVIKQSFIDNWQATLNSQYGFRFGVDQFIGWMHTIRRTPEYKNFIAAGGGNSVLQSHQYANVKGALEAVKHGGGGPLETAVKQIKEFKLLDAWRTLIVPFAESARVGEYLRAREHGASVLDGVFAAKHVTANFAQRGGFTAVRGLDRASMFLNPALQGLDQALYRMGANPFRVPEEGRKAAAAKYLSKAFVSVTLPSMYFWFHNKDDQEIADLRKTEVGSKYWFMRSPVDAPKLGLKSGDIVKIPKPIMDGQIFGTTMEATLDRMMQDDPQAVEMAAGAIGRDLSVNILPAMGVMYYGLQTNTNMAFGNPIVPEGDSELSREHQGEGRASWVARVVSQKLSPLVSDNAPEVLKKATTPAGFDYIVNNVGGMLGQDALLAVTQAVETQTKGYVPAKEEWPIVSRIFANYPSSNVAPLRQFYKRAESVQTVGQTISHLAIEDPERLLPYMGSNQADYMLVGLYAKARQDIANYRRAAEDIKNAPPGTMSSEDRRTYQRQFLTLMIETARQANAFAAAIDDTMRQRQQQ